MSQDNVLLLYEIIYDFIQQNDIEVWEITGMFRQIEFEQFCRANGIEIDNED